MERGGPEARPWQYCHVLSVAVLRTVRERDLHAPLLSRSTGLEDWTRGASAPIMQHPDPGPK